MRNWYLLTVAPASVLNSKMNAVLGRTCLLGAFMVLIFAGILIYILKDQKRRKAELIHSLYTDEITGGYSSAKFQVEAEKKIRRAEAGSLNLVSLDIDDFKFINELLGYEEGNHLIRYIHGVLEAIRHLHQSGYRILLDDFGTGYSSMAMLIDMSFDTLKIDKSFVDNIGGERGNKIVDGIIGLADSLELSTIAEGVETREQYEYLKAHGCDVIQGYYFGRPMTAESFGMLLSSRTAGR